MNTYIAIILTFIFYHNCNIGTEYIGKWKTYDDEQTITISCDYIELSKGEYSYKFNLLKDSNGYYFHYSKDEKVTILILDSNTISLKYIVSEKYHYVGAPEFSGPKFYKSY